MTRVAGQQAAHASGQQHAADPDEQMGVIGKEGPGEKSCELRIGRNRGQPIRPRLPIEGAGEETSCSTPLTMTWCKAPGASTRAARGMGGPYPTVPASVNS
jgi:hypothetical protein